MNIHDVIKKSRNSEQFTRKEVVAMLALATHSFKTYVIMAEASRISREMSGNRAEIHAQLAVNLAPCPRNCLFCSFARANNIFQTSAVLSPPEAAAQALQFELKRGVIRGIPGEKLKRDVAILFLPSARCSRRPSGRCWRDLHVSLNDKRG